MENYKLFSSFSNSSGGYVVLGVDEVNKKEKVYEINGVSRIIQGKNVVEWLNQTLHGNIEPKIIYSDPSIIELPEGDNVVLIYYIPESNKKPHYNKRDNKYYVRRNDISEAANHYLIRDMFEFTRLRNNEFKEFLIKRNLYDINNKSFGLNDSSSHFFSSHFDSLKKESQPLLVYSLIPKRPNERLIKLYKQENTNWLLENHKGCYPCKDMSFYNPYDRVYNLDGIKFKQRNNRSSIEFHNSGYVESVLCDSVFFKQSMPPLTSTTSPIEKQTVDITGVIGYLITLLSFANRYYSFLNYDDEVILQMSFRNVKGFAIDGFNQMNGRRKLDLLFWDDIPKNMTHNNYKINYPLIPSMLTEAATIEIAKELSEQILLAHGLNNMSACFIENNIDVTQYRRIRHLT